MVDISWSSKEVNSRPASTWNDIKHCTEKWVITVELGFNEKSRSKQKILVKSKLSLFSLFIIINIIKRGIWKSLGIHRLSLFLLPLNMKHHCIKLETKSEIKGINFNNSHPIDSSAQTICHSFLFVCLFFHS